MTGRIGTACRALREDRGRDVGNHPGDQQLVLFFYGEADDRSAIAAHVEACADCQATLQELRRTLAAVDSHEIPARDARYGAEVWTRIESRLGPTPARNWLEWFAPRRLAFAGAVGVLLVAAFIAGRYSSSPNPPRTAVSLPASPAPQQTSGQQEQVRDRILLVAVGDHLEHSQMVLVELMNKPPEEAVDISGTQEWARDLVPANRLIRQTANEAGEAVVADVLDDLERLFVEIAASPSRLTGAEFQQIRQRIEAQGIVFKIRVLDSQVRQRENVAPERAARTKS